MNDNIELKALAFTLKTVDGDNPNGEFEAILSTSDVDRDGETVAPGAFEPLPKSIPIHFQHDFVDKVPPIGRGEPFYDGDVLKVRGVFASTPRAQELRSLVNENMIDSMSAGFLTTRRKGKSILKGDLIEGSLTATPVNRSAMLLRSKTLLGLKAGARNSASDVERLQQIHDLSVGNGALCAPADTTKSLADLKSLYPAAVAGSFEERIDAVRNAVQAVYATDSEDTTPWIEIFATTDADVVYCVHAPGGTEETYRAAYQWNDGEPTLGTPETVDVTATVEVEPNTSTTSTSSQPEAAAPDAATAKSVAAPEAAVDDEEASLHLRARLLAIDTAVATAV